MMFFRENEIPTDRFPILYKLSDKRVFYLTKENEGFVTLIEGCDDFFCCNLTKDEMLQLAEEIKTIAYEQED